MNARPRRRRMVPLLITGLATMILMASLGISPSRAENAWPRTDLADAGFAPDLGRQIDEGVESGRFQNLHAVVVIHAGNLVMEQYYEGEDEIWGDPQGRVTFSPSELHDLRSVTKSVVSLLYGIALEDGLVPAPDATLVDQFPEYEDLSADPMRRRITVAHAFSMMLGTEWDEGFSYTDPRNSAHAMEFAPDRYRFVLDRPMMSEPGTEWNYNGGATSVLARLIETGSGLPLRAYAQERLFQPLGIDAIEWTQGRDGAFLAASGLRLGAPDLARIGQLVLNGGIWNGMPIVPEAWLRESFQPRAQVGELGYGYQWWLGPPTDDGPRWIGAFGNGGQRLFIMPERELVVVIFAGNYNQPDAWQMPVAILTEIILPGMSRRP